MCSLMGQNPPLGGGLSSRIPSSVAAKWQDEYQKELMAK